ncbi:MAG: hypothetical protein PF795_10650 [Kiritimatiellae bacterium]|jgi:ABC-type transport system involved in multi-copper enzyme maturation permease subunit|nr:hypothetical protein [Kiritimatiellia bacterium]
MNRPCIHRPIKLSSYSDRSGQALLESFGIIMLLCMILFGMVQYVMMLTATEVIQYTADASVRARAVGFNHFMVDKVKHVASIPNAGNMRTPARIPMGNADAWNQLSAGQSFNAAIRSRPSSRQYYEVEQPTIPLFLGTSNAGQMYGILDYDEWRDGPHAVRGPYYSRQGNLLRVTIMQDYPLRMPLWRAFSDNNHIQIRQEARLADHAEHYLQ